MKLYIIHCGPCGNFMGESELNLEGAVVYCADCARGRWVGRVASPGGVLATPEAPQRGVEQYDSAKTVARSTGIKTCGHAQPNARFQCMRCLNRSLMCGPCSMAGNCLHCSKSQPKTVDAFMAGLEAGLNGEAPLSREEMGAEAQALDEAFGDDLKIRVWGNEGR